MSSYRTARVLEVRSWGDEVAEVGLEMEDGAASRGVVLEALTGPVAPGDTVIANTTAVELSLGSGGYHFIVWNLSRRSLDTGGEGHIMKLRYTPMQVNVEAAEERLTDVTPGEMGRVLGGMPVIAGELHSQLLPVALAFRHASPGGRLAYIMTDGGALPASFSHTSRFLRENGYISSVISSGHAFGGDLEAVTVFGALAAAKRLAGADAAVVLMGPGIVGTGSAVGFSGIEQGVVVNAAACLGGRPIAIPRITFADERERHKGLSHHTVAVLRHAARSRAMVAFPAIEGERGRLIADQVREAELELEHDLLVVDATGVLELMSDCRIKGSVMGRGIDREPEFFMAAAAAGLIAAEWSMQS